MRKSLYKLVVVPAVFFGLAGVAQASSMIVNGSFEDYVVGLNDNSSIQTDASNVNGWNTTATDNKIEIWRGPYLGVSAYLGTQFAELNADQPSDLYQIVNIPDIGATIGYEFAHRGRVGVDTLSLVITDVVTNTVIFNQQFADGETWRLWSGTVPNYLTDGHALKFSWNAGTTGSGDPTIGNFLDVAAFGVGIGRGEVPEPATMLLLGAGLLGLGGLRFKRKK